MSVFSFLGTVKDSIGIFSLKLLLNVFLVQEWIPILSRSINVVSWFLCVETFSFFVLPWVIKKQKTVPTIKASIVVLIIVEFIIALIAKKMPLNIYSEIIYEQYDIIEWFVYRFPLFRFVDVLLGYYIGSLYLTNNNKQIKNATQKEIIVCIINVVVIIISAYYHISPYNDSVIQIQNVWWNHVVVFTPASLMLIYLFAFEEGAISKSIANKKIIKIAELSPYAFLIQYPINIYFSYTLTYVCKITNIELGCDKLITLIISISISLVLSNIWNKSTKKIRTINNVLW